MGRAHEADVAVDQHALPVKRLIADLYGSAVRRPAIVVGGGPSAPAQLELLRPLLDTAAILSANGHAWKLGLGAHYVVCKDNRHTETGELMEPRLRPFGAPIIGRHYWADYRLPRWPVQGNSGMMALGVAALMGCAPIFPIGFDCYQNGTYFHDPDAKNVSRGLRDSLWRSRYQRLRAKLVTADIRLLDASPLSVSFPRYVPGEPPRGQIPPVFDFYRGMQTHYGRATRTFPQKQDPQVEVPAGTVFAMDGEELAFYRRTHCVEPVDNAAASGVQLCAQATAAEGSTPDPQG